MDKTAVVLSGGGALIVANLLASGQGSDLWQTLWSGKIATSTRGKWSAFLTEVLFLIVLAYLTDVSDTAGDFAVLILVGAWVAFLINNGPALVTWWDVQQGAPQQNPGPTASHPGQKPGTGPA